MQIRPFYLALTCSLIAVSSSIRAQDTAVAPLNNDEQAAIETVTVRKVQAAVSFLASDEMAGRNTPSPELDIATAYVATRFRAAGLEGGGPDGSFYQEHFWPMISLPRDGIKIQSGLNDVRYRGVLHALPDPTDVAGMATILGSEKPDGPLTEIVVIDELAIRPTLNGNVGFILSLYSRRIASLAKNGAKVILVRTADDSQLPEIAAEMLSKPLAPPRRFPLPCPIVLIGSSNLKEQVRVTVPASEKADASVKNVIGVLKGSDPTLSAEAIVVSAHLDHIGMEKIGPDRINNGADDNASGVTGVLLMAEAFSELKQRPKRTMIFMTFWGEEKGLLGSKNFVQNPTWPLDRIVANINLEMIGRPEAGAEAKAWMTGWGYSDLGTLLAKGAARANVEVFNHKQFGDQLFRRSDNYPFVEGGVIGHSISAGSLHADYHKPTDHWEKLNLPHMTQVIRGLIAGTLPIADGQFTPQLTK